ncbi:MAG: CCXG family PEP-CTERM protein [Acetobacteraceae bacterium]|nr:CCXG family PEP-CTERM protein [Acetobacteraceae bacterium]
MLRASLLAATALFLGAASASASVITMDTRYSTAGAQASAAAYRSLIDGLAAAPATAGYGSGSVNSFNSLSNRATFGGSNSNIAYRYTIDFGVTAAMAGNWDFRIGVDFGRGGAVFLDGTAIDMKTNDMWWAGSYANTTQSFQFTRSLGAGNHVLAVYGLEGCCDGAQQGQFRAAGQSGFTTFSTTDGLNLLPGGIAAVPEPAALGLFAAGLLGLGLLRQRRAG